MCMPVVILLMLVWRLITGKLSQFHTRPAAVRQLGVCVWYQLVRAAVFMAQGQYVPVISNRHPLLLLSLLLSFFLTLGRYIPEGV